MKQQIIIHPILATKNRDVQCRVYFQINMPEGDPLDEKRQRHNRALDAVSTWRNQTHPVRAQIRVEEKINCLVEYKYKPQINNINLCRR